MVDPDPKSLGNPFGVVSNLPQPFDTTTSYPALPSENTPILVVPNTVDSGAAPRVLSTSSALVDIGVPIKTVYDAPRADPSSNDQLQHGGTVPKAPTELCAPTRRTDLDSDNFSLTGSDRQSYGVDGVNLCTNCTQQT